MNTRKRFSLATVFVVTTAVAAFFGYAQWRSLRLNQECRELVAEGANVTVQEHWLWPTVSNSAGVFFRMSANRFENGDRVYAADEAIEHFNSLNARLKNMGVEKVSIFVERTTSKNQTYLVSLGSIDGLAGLSGVEAAPRTGD